MHESSLSIHRKNLEFVVFIPYLRPKLRNCRLSLSVRVQKKVQSGRQKNIGPKTLDLFYTYHNMYIGINKMAYSKRCAAAAGQRHASAKLPPPPSWPPPQTPHCHRHAVAA